MTAQLRQFDETGKISAAGLAAGRPVLYDKQNNKNLAPRKARQGACVVGRSKLKDTDTISYALDLNEANVQAIFNRCIAKEGTPEDQCFNSILFSRLRGYSPDAERIVVFNRENFLANKKYIQ